VFSEYNVATVHELITEGCYVGSSRNMCMLAASSVWAGWTGLSAQFVLHSDDLRGD